ncbi:MAG: hypothetical protein Q9222_000834 [Ikaeria aurantiellina]
MPFIRRVHLAVGAFIRHTYTDYDRLLKSHSYLDARSMVQPVTLDKIIEWRDEKDEPDAVEDILREVIVISDDEEDDELVESHGKGFDDRENSVEIISTHEGAGAVHVQPLDYSVMDKESRFDPATSPEDDWAPGVKFIRRVPTPSARIQVRQNRIDRQKAHRNRVWLDAIKRRRDTQHTVQTSGSKSLGRPQASRDVASTFVGYPPQIGHEKYNGNDAEQHRQDISSIAPSRTTDKTMRGPVDDEILIYDKSNQREFPPRALRDRIQRSIHPDYAISTSDHLIPSIESDPTTTLQGPKSQRHGINSFGQHEYDNRIGNRTIVLDDDPMSPVSKRRRVIETGPSLRKPFDPPMSEDKSFMSEPSTHRISPYGVRREPERIPNGLPFVANQDERAFYQRMLVPLAGSQIRDSRGTELQGNIKYHGEDQGHLYRVVKHPSDPLPGYDAYQRSPIAASPSRQYEYIPVGQASQALGPGLQTIPEGHARKQPVHPSHPSGFAQYASKQSTNTKASETFYGEGYHVRDLPIRSSLQLPHHSGMKTPIDGSFTLSHGTQRSPRDHNDYHERPRLVGTRHSEALLQRPHLSRLPLHGDRFDQDPYSHRGARQEYEPGLLHDVDGRRGAHDQKVIYISSSPLTERL